MSLFDSYVSDPWAPLSHKKVIGDGGPAGETPGTVAPAWCGDHARRLRAYAVLAAYQDNVSRHFLPSTDSKERANHREYGDAGLLVAQARTALIGNDQDLVVPLAGEEPVAPDVGDADPGAQADYASDLAAWEVAKDVEDFLRRWGTKEKFKRKLIETENLAVGLGDAVVRLTWSTESRRPKLAVYDPSYYFPVLDDSDYEFPRRVHLAWDVVAINGGGYVQLDKDAPLPENAEKRKERGLVRRLTYELVALPEGQTRTYPWAEEDAPPSRLTCLFTDAIYEPERGQTVDDFGAPIRFIGNEDGFEINQIDLQIDFLPVVHIPNTPAGQWHFGRSILTGVAQLLEDVQDADSDLASAASIAGVPPVVVSGTRLQSDDGVDVSTMGPGQIFYVGEGNSASLLDTYNALVPLGDYLKNLSQRLCENARIPGSVLGRIEGQIPSGVALALSFGPLQALVQEMRLVREEKYSLLLAFVQKMAMAGGVLPAGAVVDANVTFGSYLPVDRTAAVNEVSTLLGAKAISRQTAVEFLVAAGFDVGDANEEVARIEQSDFAGAAALLDATGDEGLVFEYLHTKPTENRPPPPPPDLLRVPPNNIPPPPPQTGVE